MQAGIESESIPLDTNRAPKEVSIKLRSRPMLGALLFGISIVVFLALTKSGLRRDDAQIFLFPGVLISLWLGISHYLPSVPRGIFSLGILMWVLSIASVKANFFGTYSQVVSIARLGESQDDVYARSLKQGVSELARYLDVPTPRLLSKKFEKDSSIKNLFKKSEQSLLLLTGDPLWLTIHIKPGLLTQFLPKERVSVSKEVLDDSKQWSVSENENVIQLHSGFGDLRLLAVTSPDAFGLPGLPKVLAVPFLAWFSRGIEAASGGYSDAVRLTRQEDSLLEASEIVGPWRTNSTRGAARAILGNIFLLEAAFEKSFQYSLFSCALSSYRRAASFVPNADDKNVYAIINNNAAVAALSRARRQEDIEMARFWFERAISIFDDKGSPVLAAKIAMRNLIALERAGLIE